MKTVGCSKARKNITSQIYIYTVTHKSIRMLRYREISLIYGSYFNESLRALKVYRAAFLSTKNVLQGLKSSPEN